MELHPLLELPPLLEMGLPPLPGMEQGNSRRQEDLVSLVGSLISGLLVRCASSPNHWEGRSSGSCHWRSLESLLLPGSGVHTCKATCSSNRWYSGACACSLWASSLAWRGSSTRTPIQGGCLLYSLRSEPDSR